MTTIAFSRWLDPKTRHPTETPSGAFLERVLLPARWITCRVCEKGGPCPRCSGTGKVLVPDREMAESDVIECYYRQLEIERFNASNGTARLTTFTALCTDQSPRHDGALYDIILVDDDVHSYYYVVHMLELVFSLSPSLAYHMTRLLDGHVQIPVFTCHHELAEILCNQITSFGPDLRIPQSGGSMSAFIEVADLNLASDPLIRALEAERSENDPERDQRVNDLTEELLDGEDGEPNDGDDQDDDDLPAR